MSGGCYYSKRKYRSSPFYGTGIYTEPWEKGDEIQS
jgi:hypothetical protein